MTAQVTTNWAGNVVFSARRLHRPASVAELQSLVGDATRVRVLGTGHSFNRIADTTGDLLALDALPRVAEIDTAGRAVRVSGGMRYAELAYALRGSGLALANTASLPHISLAGACATGTHGSGTANRILPAGVRALTLVTATGDVLRIDRDSTELGGAALALGRLGVVIDLELDLEPYFEVAQTVVEEVDEAEVVTQLERVLGSAYSVSVFTTWAQHRKVQVWVKEKVGRAGAWAGAPLWGGRAADGPRHMIEGMPTEFTTQQLGVPGSWAERLPHFRAEFMPSSGVELQSEYLLPMRSAAAAWEALSQVRERVASVLQVSEIRAVAGDDLWLSPTGGEDCVAFHFTWVADAAAVLPVVALVEERLAGLGARPHWGKIFTLGAEHLAERYPALERFGKLVAELDPTGKFGNDLVDGWLGLSAG